jgi:hypothetical protein
VTQSADILAGPQNGVPASGDRAELIAKRIRQNAGRRAAPPDSRIPWYALEHAVSGDLGHLHAAHDLRKLPMASRRRLTAPLVVGFKRTLWRLLYPLPEAQSVWNGANARVMTFLLRQLAAQERTIESLERQVSELYDERRR